MGYSLAMVIGFFMDIPICRGDYLNEIYIEIIVEHVDIPNYQSTNY